MCLSISSVVSKHPSQNRIATLSELAEIQRDSPVICASAASRAGALT